MVFELHISGDPAESSVQGLATEGGHRSEGAGNSSYFGDMGDMKHSRWVPSGKLT